jgi:hypothetical protein
MTRVSPIWVLFLGTACGGGADDDAGADGAGETCPPEVPPTCYDADPSTAGIGSCHAGVPRCDRGEMVECIGAVLPGLESCNGLDDDCDGEADKGVCREACIGLDCDRPWGQPPTRFVVGPGGGMALQLSNDDPVAVLWVPEQNTGTLAKVDTRTWQILARYLVVPVEQGCPEDGEMVHSIAVDPDGNVYVSTQDTDPSSPSQEVRLLSIANQDCADRDGDGTVETSNGPDDVLTFPEDECIRWQVPIDVDNRNAAIALERNARRAGSHWLVWGARGDTARVWAIDPETGEETGGELFLDADAHPTFFDFDGRGIMYAKGGRNELALIDTAALEIDLVHVAMEIDVHQMIQDHRGRIWIVPYLSGYDRDFEEWLIPSAYDGLEKSGPSALRFVAAPTGVIYSQTIDDIDGAESGQLSSLTYDIEADNLAVDLQDEMPPSSFALDRDGMIWEVELGPGGNPSLVDCAAGRQPSSAWVLDPWSGERELAINGDLWGASIFTDNPTGVYPLDVLPGPRSAVWTLAGCDLDNDGDTLWGALDWSASRVEDAHILFEVQGGDDLEWSPDGPWFRAGEDPAETGPVPLREIVPEPHPYLHVRATLWTDERVPPFVSPELLRISAAYACPDDVD